MKNRVFNQFQDIILEIKDGISRITMNRPEVLNASREIMMDEMIEAIRISELDPDVGVMVLTGAGRAFNSGADISMMLKFNEKNGRWWNKRMRGLCMAFRDLPFPVIAMVNGPCMGGGNEFQFYCDLVIASDRAYFGQTGAKVGACPVVGATQYAASICGERFAKELMFLANRWSAEEAYARGMINKVVPHDKLEEETMKWCKKILTLNRDTIRVMKTNIHFESDQLYASWAHGMEMLNSIIWGSPKMVEGMTAFLEKREPNFNQFYNSEAVMPSYYDALIQDNVKAAKTYYEEMIKEMDEYEEQRKLMKKS